ncbi:MAG: putative FAD-binding dehydrogenase [Firmicutes bacterium ADurb.Bin099]|nr:MAG: putative FAD-binding dehydrogenase [Firmicutes bacterium ADurb.Bin099]
MKLTTETTRCDLCVVGGGISGVCAAIAAARRGLKVVLMQERPVLGGNASSEIRMWICGCKGLNNRETGILEEIQLDSLYRNPYKLYPVWDSLIYNKVISEPNITLMLNCSCCKADMDKDKIQAVYGWQMTSQTWQKVEADYFADCSGDSILAPLTGAEYRMGRESKEEFGEDIPLTEPDSKTMGNSCLIQARKLDHEVTFKAPPFATKLTREDVEKRHPNIESSYENFWYLELGGDRNTIKDAESIRDELVALAYGMWDYIKNSGDYDAGCWQLDFIGFLPGKRESRRLMGDHIMTQKEISADTFFPDTIAYGGWPLDDHDPGGFWHPGRASSIIPTPKPYKIPLSVLYSRNIDNLWFAGRNISMTHAAMSSSRIMATCALLGQAVGESCAVAKKYNLSPRLARKLHISEIQQNLMENDCFLPGFIREISPLCKKATLSSDPHIENLDNLRSGTDRDHQIYDGPQGVYIRKGGSIEYTLEKATKISKVRMVFDSDLDRNTLPGDLCERTHTMRASINIDAPVMTMPKTLVKSYKLTAQLEDGSQTVLIEDTENIKRLIKINAGKKIKRLTLTLLSDWSENGAYFDDKIHLFSFDFS